MKSSCTPSCSLLPWQILLVFFTAGCLGTTYLLPALVGGLFILLFIRWCRVKIPLIGILLVALLGYVYASMRIPQQTVPMASSADNTQTLTGFKYSSTFNLFRTLHLRLSEQPETLHCSPDGRVPGNDPWKIGNGRQVKIVGRVHASQWRFSHRLYVFVREVRLQNGTQEGVLPGTLLVSVRHADTAPLPGQKVLAELRLRPVHSLKNTGCWDGEAYWARKGVFWRAYSKDLANLVFEPVTPGWLASLRRHLRNQIRSVVPPGPGQGMSLALLLGDRSGLDQKTYTLLQRAGIVHSLALSGLHLGFMALFGWAVARGMGWMWPGIYLFLPRPKLAVIMGVPLVIFYMWLGGWTPSLLRAGIMFASWGGLLLVNRSRVLLDGLCLAVLLILLWSPGEIFGLSLPFSVLSVAGIILVVPSVQGRIAAWSREDPVKRVLGYLVMIMVVSLVASGAILPLMAWNFGNLTPHLYYNVIWIPLLGFFLLPLGFMGLFLSLVPGMEGLGSELVVGVAHGMEMWCDVLDMTWKGGWLETIQVVRPQWPEILGWYAMMLMALALWKGRKMDIRGWLPLCAFSLILLVTPTMMESLAGITRRCRVVVMDTGMSQAVYVEFPGNRRMLVDGGGSWNRDFDMGKAVVTPVLTWGRPPRIHKVLLSHSDCDHLRGLIHPLSTCQVDDFYWNGRLPAAGWDRDALQGVMQDQSFAVHQVRAGMSVDMGKRARIEILHPTGNVAEMSRNDGSLVVRCVVDGKGLILIPGDIEARGIKTLLQGTRDLQADILVLPHHGSDSSWSYELYDRVRPKLAIAAAGWNNRYRFPGDKVVAALKQRGIPLLTTGIHGAVEIVWPAWKDSDTTFKVSCARGLPEP